MTSIVVAAGAASGGHLQRYTGMEAGGHSGAGASDGQIGHRHPVGMFSSIMHPGHDRLRAGDRDREAVAELLRCEHLCGRLERDELERRLESCLIATTYADLWQLVADLPNGAPAVSTGRPPPARATARSRARATIGSAGVRRRLRRCWPRNPYV